MKKVKYKYSGLQEGEILIFLPNSGQLLFLLMKLRKIK
jgi:hypothetical protein